MILIVDSGASKADWALTEKGTLVKILISKGISPIFQSSEHIYSIVNEVFNKEQFVKQVEKIIFYGAGCIKGYNSEIVEIGLSKFFKNIEIDVQGDMIGAARALFGYKAGIACILGTGANSCKYNGNEIVEKIPTLGYILGDECSGAYLGKILINNYFKKIMPKDLCKEFENDYNPVEKDILDKVYKQPSPNSYLASYTHFIKKHREHDYIKELLTNSFQSFITNNIAKYANYQNFNIGLVGSVAFHFSEIFIKVAMANGLMISRILEKPIEGLVEYHD